MGIERGVEGVGLSVGYGFLAANFVGEAGEQFLEDLARDEDADAVSLSPDKSIRDGGLTRICSACCINCCSSP